MKQQVLVTIEYKGNETPVASEVNDQVLDVMQLGLMQGRLDVSDTATTTIEAIEVTTESYGELSSDEVVKTAYRKFLTLPSLTDVELEALYKHMNNVITVLAPLGDGFKLCRNEAVSVAYAADSFLRARKR